MVANRYDVTNLASATKAQYRHKGLALLRRAAASVGIEDWRQNPQAVCAELSAWRLKFMPATWRLYRAALVHCLNSKGYPEQARYILKLSQTPCVRKSTATSTRKYKNLQRILYSKLRKELKRGRGKYDQLIRKWLIIGSWTGLRPCEWRFAQVIKNKFLLIGNAKATHNRSFGQMRALRLDGIRNCPAIVQRFLILLPETMQDNELSFDMLYKQCRARLLQVHHKIGYGKKRHITLYTPRHQFAADMKRRNASNVQLAAAMGHRSPRTAQVHYGRRIAGRWRTRKVGPTRGTVLAHLHAQQTPSKAKMKPVVPKLKPSGQMQKNPSSPRKVPEQPAVETVNPAPLNNPGHGPKPGM